MAGMENKVIKLPVILILLSSLQGFSQTTQTSKHPKLDAYYSQKQDTDTSKALTTPATPVPETKSAPAVMTKPAVKKPTTTVQVPVQKKIQTSPTSTIPYIETRLGSSSKLYDTYEKNNNGEGAVTTSPK